MSDTSNKSADVRLAEIYLWEAEKELDDVLKSLITGVELQPQARRTHLQIVYDHVRQMKEELKAKLEKPSTSAIAHRDFEYQTKELRDRLQESEGRATEEKKYTGELLKNLELSETSNSRATERALRAEETVRELRAELEQTTTRSKKNEDNFNRLCDSIRMTLRVDEYKYAEKVWKEYASRLEAE